MDELNTSLIVSGRGGLVKTFFDRPVSVQGKSIGVKSVSFPNLESQPIRYKVKIKDSRGVSHTLSLPPYKWEWSDDLMYAIYQVLSDLYESLDASNQQTYIINQETPDIEITNFRKPQFQLGGIHRPYTSISYGDSGLKILHTGIFASHDDVFSLLKGGEAHSDDGRFAYRPHELKQPEAPQKESAVTEPVYLYCDAIKPSYVGRVKRRIIE